MQRKAGALPRKDTGIGKLSAKTLATARMLGIARTLATAASSCRTSYGACCKIVKRIPMAINELFCVRKIVVKTFKTNNLVLVYAK
jgi:hypothetical protein